MPATLRIPCLLPVVALFGNLALGQQLSKDNYDQLVPAGKEVDAIYGDFALVTPAAKAVIAAPKSTRNANMTVRTVGGCLIDFVTTQYESDQLSAFYPGRRRFVFSEVTADDQAVVVASAGTKDKPKCEVRYELLPDQPVMEVTSTWTNTTPSDWTLRLEDDIRADGGKEDMVKSPNGVHDLCYFHDIFWRQACAVRAEGYQIRCTTNSRECVLRYENSEGQQPVIKPGDSFTFKRLIMAGPDLPTVLALADRLDGKDVSAVADLTLKDSTRKPVASARFELSDKNGSRGTVITDEDGQAVIELPPGEYTANATVAGVPIFAKDSIRLRFAEGTSTLDLTSDRYAAGTVKASIVSEKRKRIPAKVEFIGSNDTPSPNWGPESAEYFVKNLAYTEDGAFQTPLMAGTYDIIISHGPEYDAVFTKLKVEPGKTARLNATLRRSVKTPGWISSDFHSHSSPSGDNTGSQKGRVLNLAAENIEFAPCTEHNRVSTYSHHIAELSLKPFLATVSGMELTGQPLPLNHQNVFPMRHTPRTQDGGGPVTDSSPENQMERLALWDDRSEKLIQQNHPDIGWLFYDKNGDGTPDEGYSRSFPLMDVMEIHPIDRILNITRFDERGGKPFNNQRMLNWLQLLNHGFRIYGVVNTDAHYNFHGSGWLRNWIQSSTDDPAKIDPMEMVQASEQGRLIMSNGPYLEAVFRETGKRETAVSGQDLAAKSGNITVDVRVQCANWLDIDRVFLLINGKMSDQHTFTRADNPEMFSDDVVRFDQSIKVTLSEDSHIIVVTGHKTARLGDVMGPMGVQHPAALTNPVFVDVDDNGFQPDKDTLGFPLPVRFSRPN